jgi:DNA-binding PadR family transcriptional regulator
MLELATLGLLCEAPLHGYQLKKQLEQFMSGCISANYGAIYPLLKRLEAQNYITTLAEEAGDGGPTRRIYRITASGRDRWRQTMMEHPQESWVNSRARFMIKFFFFSHLDAHERIELLEHRLMVCRLRLQQSEQQKTEPAQQDYYKAIAWQRHLTHLRFEIQWVQDRLADEHQQTEVAGIG